MVVVVAVVIIGIAGLRRSEIENQGVVGILPSLNSFLFVIIYVTEMVLICYHCDCD